MAPLSNIKPWRALFAWTGQDTCPYAGRGNRGSPATMLKLRQPNASRRATPHGATAGGPRNSPPQSGSCRAAQTRGRHRSQAGRTKAGLEQAKAAVKADEATRRKYESAIQDLQGKISKYRDQSLAVKTNEQYKALLHEIQFAEQDIKANEDKILELMLNADARDKDVKAAELELKAEMAEIEKEKAAAR